MNKRLLKILPAGFTILLMIFAFLVSGCDEKRNENHSANILVMGTSGDFPPFEFYQTNQSAEQMVGFDIELAKRICQYLGYELEVKDLDFSTIIPSLQSGRIDFAMAGINPTEERRKSLDFSSIYYLSSNVLVIRTQENFLKLKTFQGKKIGVQLGSTQEQFARFWAYKKSGLKLVALNRVNDLVQELRSKRIDGVILENTIASAYALRNPDTFDIEPLEDTKDGMAIAFAKNSSLRQEFERALEHLREIGYLDKLIQKWFGTPEQL